MDSNAEDRLSALSDKFLLQILAKLPTKYAVGCTSLSRRWNNDLWRLLPDLDFDQELLTNPESCYDDPVIEAHFVNFVDRVLELSPTPIRKFKLHTVSNINSSDIVSWIVEAIIKDVVEVDLDVNSDEIIDLPQDLYSCESLEILRLHSEFSMTIPPSQFVCFLNLKVLYMVRIFYDQDDVAEQLFSSCPRLEDLSIDGTVIENTEVTFNIKSPKLRILRMKLKNLSYSDEMVKKCVVLICSSCLEFLEIKDDFLAIYTVVSSPCLVKAIVDVGMCIQMFEKHKSRSKFAFKFLETIPDVRSLSLSAKTCAALEVAEETRLLQFDKLTCLELGIADCCGWKLASALLYNSPALEMCVFKKEGEHVYEPELKWQGQDFIPSFLSHLKTIEVWGFEGLKHELQLVNYLLANAKGLNKMTIGTHRFPAKKELKLSKYLRASKACQIEFSRDSRL